MMAFFTEHPARRPARGGKLEFGVQEINAHSQKWLCHVGADRSFLQGLKPSSCKPHYAGTEVPAS